MPPIVIIRSNSSLDEFYEDIQRSIDARFHNYKLHCPVYSESEAEAGQRETNTAYAQHAGDGGLPPGVHPERWIK